MSDNHNIDELDKKILSIISKNARTPFLEVARECGVSGAAVHQRVQRLTNIGIITGSEFIVSPQNLGYKTCAFVGINLKKACLYQDIAEELYKIPEIIECHYVTGNYSLFIKVMAHDNEHLRKILSDKLQRLDIVERTETIISLEESFRRQFPIESKE
ncbi:MAG: Lrp/AsnC ligand binding domain-containing protein [Salinivirgaceae bacterium]|jgi:Lrp/AsnC family transcriptional regulator for asnA, asnC and gidA|nr:Lrp/AsnC ligand binding domain-containing protein [Salinivirgaceae bacterium]MBO7496330.1 Lrp/AsnC ligand binding domain-containing protein [Salinivirgaceae bacterium]MBR5958211.1 Lrp/AsnC ligand binding domain-containing protein [Salinivirgaceae bacterium]